MMNEIFARGPITCSMATIEPFDYGAACRGHAARLCLLPGGLQPAPAVCRYGQRLPHRRLPDLPATS